ncbi:MAG: zinc-binding dehydrogenase [Pseudomonadales bacterium]|nr:zinc-binding dehydrogenase [Halioglobus sp.]MCP5130891.1 zinc-binding dehydrogenase [Pseudomonadales bacterium]
MKAVVMRNESLSVEQVADPEPGPGEVLVRTLACGICGSDLHMFKHCDHALSSFKRGNIPISFDPAKGVVFGHEYCAEILDYGPGTDRKLKVGTRVCSVPLVFKPDTLESVGYSNSYPGGYGERMVLSEMMLVPVPGDLPSNIAALTEPMSIATHALVRAQLQGDEVPIVIGCGPIGLAMILALKARGIGPVVASDFSPGRRALAEKMGADIIVDPAANSPYQSWLEVAAPADYDMHSPMALMGLGPAPKPCVIFECVGVPGIIQQVLASAPPRSRLMVVGVCMEADSIEPLMAISKEMNVHFVYGYTGEEFAQTLVDLADGKLDAAPIVTSTVQPEGVAEAFETLSRPEDEAKIMINFD